MNIPVTLVTGFLGSGKTTIISGLVAYLRAQNQQVVYIKNELGSENVDSQIMKGQHIQTRELLNGCICCTLVGPFMSAIDEVIDTLHPDRIIIEASGAADPSALALMISSHPRLQRDGVLSVIDVVHFEGYHDLSIAAQHQATFTDLIVFNKVELADDDQKLRVVGYVRELNQFAPIVEAIHGQLPPLLAFGISQAELTRQLNQNESHQHDHLATDQLSTLTLHLGGNFTLEEIKHACSQLPKQLFRLKGVLKPQDQTAILLNKVGNRIDIQPAPEVYHETHVNNLVCIGFELDTMIDRLLEIFQQAQIEATIVPEDQAPHQ